jgi:hypothetical protein
LAVVREFREFYQHEPGIQKLPIIKFAHALEETALADVRQEQFKYPDLGSSY